MDVMSESWKDTCRISTAGCVKNVCITRILDFPWFSVSYKCMTFSRSEVSSSSKRPERQITFPFRVIVFTSNNLPSSMISLSCRCHFILSACNLMLFREAYSILSSIACRMNISCRRMNAPNNAGIMDSESKRPLMICRPLRCIFTIEGCCLSFPAEYSAPSF